MLLIISYYYLKIVMTLRNLFFRLTKKLGPAILKAIYQAMLTGNKISSNYDKILDMELNLIPLSDGVHAVWKRYILLLKILQTKE